MADTDDTISSPPRRSVFLSYASEDRAAARSLRDCLPAYGLEVWYDESELGGGEAWDQKIRRQIRECDFFMPLLSANTEARREGYFRREWRLAAERTLDMADDHLFLLPIVIDETDLAAATVPEKFLTVQWLKVPGGQPTRALETLCRRLASGAAQESDTSRAPARAPARRKENKTSVPAPPSKPVEFPREHPGERLRFWVEVAGWGARSAWDLFNRLPRWVRYCAYTWAAIAAVSGWPSSKHQVSADTSIDKAERLKEIAGKSHGTLSSDELVKIGAKMAKEFADDSDDEPAGSSLLAVPFTAPPGDPAATKLADSAFTMSFGKISIAHHGQVVLTKDPLPSHGLGDALERARLNHSTYVLCGAVATTDKAQTLTVQIATVADGSVLWSKSYPLVGADPAAIATEVETKIPALAAPPS